MPELVEDGVSGFLVTPGNADELAAALERLASSPEERESMGRAGRRKVVDEFDAEKCAALLATLFQETRRRAHASDLGAGAGRFGPFLCKNRHKPSAAL